MSKRSTLTTVRGRTLSTRASAVLIFFASIAAYILVALIIGQYFLIHAYYCVTNLYMGILNVLPIFFVMMLVYFLSNNAVFGVTLGTSLATVFALISRLKIAYRQDPLVPADIKVAKEGLAILDGFNAGLIVVAVLAILVIAALIFLSLRYCHSQKLKTPVRIIGALCVVAVFCAFYFTAYRSEDLYDQYPVNGSQYFKVNQYVSKGVIYSFLYDTWDMRVTEPEGYDPDTYREMEAKAAAPETFADTEKPNLLIIMSEAFTNFSNNEHLSFEGYTDPLAFYNELLPETVLSGQLAVSVYGGGTAATEFEMLDAMRAMDIDSGISPYGYIRHNIDGMTRRLSSIGYETLAIHPGNAWFYNRQNVYDYMNFNDFLCIDHGFDQATVEIKGNYIAEQATFDVLIDRFCGGVKNSDAPQFTFCVTIQNHGTYGGKYGDLEPNFSSDVALPEATTAEMSGYFVGIADADAQLKRLIGELNALDEPVVLVYFGDHRPYFADAYTELTDDINAKGTPEQTLNTFTTPFFIWQNKAAADTTPMAANLAALDLGDSPHINAGFLGSTLFELLGFEGLSPFFDYANQVRDALPTTLFNKIYLHKDGSITETLTDEEQKILDLYRNWAYYKIFDEEIAQQ